MKAWLKGGLIGLVVWFIEIILIGAYCLSGTCQEMGCLACVLLFSSVEKPILVFPLILGILPNLIIHFLIGAIIGFIIQKIKSKKQEVIK